MAMLAVSFDHFVSLSSPFAFKRPQNLNTEEELFFIQSLTTI